MSRPFEVVKGSYRDWCVSLGGGEWITCDTLDRAERLSARLSRQYRSRARLLAELCTVRGFYWKRVKLGRAAKYFRWANRLREVANG